ncbi:MAG: hypothetical protein WCQ16_03825 [Verrucomicrobiae bacterium]
MKTAIAVMTFLATVCSLPVPAQTAPAPAAPKPKQVVIDGVAYRNIWVRPLPPVNEPQQPTSNQ